MLSQEFQFYFQNLQVILFTITVDQYESHLKLPGITFEIYFDSDCSSCD